MNQETVELLRDNAVHTDEAVYLKYRSLKEINRAKVTTYLEKLIELQQLEEELAVDLETRQREHAAAIHEALEALGDNIQCSFCGKTKDQVKQMVTAPSGACICNECVSLCGDIISSESEDTGDP